MKEVAFFGVADSAAYVPKLVTALSSTRRFCPDASFFIVGDSERLYTSVPLMRERNISLVHMNLEDYFRKTEGIDFATSWPSECFWWMKAYETFQELGFDYSVQLDGDVLCLSPLDQESLPSNDHMALVEKGNKGFNSGVMLLNNRALADFGFFEKALDVYRTRKICDHDSCLAFCRQLGDQHLLDLISKSHSTLKTRRLASRYNYLLPKPKREHDLKNANVYPNLSTCVFAHLIHKPWDGNGSREYVQSIEAYRLWIAFASTIWNEAEMSEHFPQLSNN